MTANTNQCGSPVRTGSSFTFNLKLDGTNCGRNQAMPIGNGGSGVFILNPGKVYTWTFHYVDGTPNGGAPGMGTDRGEAQSLIWQMHNYASCSSPQTTPSLGFANNGNGIGSGPQTWVWASGAGNRLYSWAGPYTPGEQDDWKIQVLVSQTAAGWEKVWRNGVLVVNMSGLPNYNCANGVWWNFGPYKWRWESPDAGGSSMTEVNATINGMTLTSP
jgi:hypothetical protein